MTVQGKVLHTPSVFTPIVALHIVSFKKKKKKKKAAAGICVSAELGGFLRAVYGGFCQSVTASQNRRDVGFDVWGHVYSVWWLGACCQ